MPNPILTPAQREEMFLAYRRMACWWAKKMHFAHESVRRLGLDDVCQEAQKGLLQAIDRWNGDQRTFVSYAKHYVRNAIQHACRYNSVVRAPRRAAEGNQPWPFVVITSSFERGTDWNEVVEPTCPNADKAMGAWEARELVAPALEELRTTHPKMHRAVLLSANGDKGVEIARILRTSPKRVRSLLYRGRKFLRLRLLKRMGLSSRSAS